VLRLAVDQDFNEKILKGVHLGIPSLEALRVSEVGLSEAEDREILAWAAGEGRVVLTHDRKTMMRHAYERMAPASHAATREEREAMKQAYRAFAELFRAAAQDLRSGMKGVKFPPGSFPRGLPYVPPEAAGRSRRLHGCSFWRTPRSPGEVHSHLKTRLQSRFPGPDHPA